MSSYQYKNHGPFHDNSAPGINADFCNDINNCLLALNPSATDSYISSNGLGVLTILGLAINQSPVTINGTTSGSINVYQYLQGSVKKCLVYLNNYKATSSQSVNLPVAFTGVSLWQVTELQGGKLEALSGGNAQTFSIQTSIAAAGGSQSPQTFINSWSTGMCRSGFATLRVTVTGGTATTGLAIVEGI